MKRLFALLLALAFALGLAVLATADDTPSISHTYEGAYSGEKRLNRLTKGQSATLKFTIYADPYELSDYIDGTGEIRYSSDSLPIQNGKSIKFTYGGSKTGKLRFYAEVPVTYNGSIDTSIGLELYFETAGPATSSDAAGHSYAIDQFVTICEPYTGSESGDSDVTCSFNGPFSGSSLQTRITRNKNTTLKFSIGGFKLNRSDFIASTAEVLYSSSSLPVQKNKDIQLIVGQNSAGRLSFDVEIPVTYNGSADKWVSFTLFFQTKDPSDPTHIIDHSYKFSEEITACETYVKKTTDDDEDDDEDDIAPLTPYIIVSNYSYGGTSVAAGSEFTLYLTIRNTSSECDLENIKMNLVPRGFFSVASSSNTFYIDQLPAKGELSKSVVIKAGMSKNTDNDDTNSISISFDYQYLVDEKTRAKGNSDEIITIPVIFPDRFELGMLEIENETVFAGDDCNIYLPMVNKGRSSVYNLSASVECEDCAPVQMQYMGNLGAGNDTGADFTLVFPEGGDFEGTIVVTYEDANGEERVTRAPFTVHVEGFEEPFNGGEFVPPDDFPIEGDDIEDKPGLLSKRNLAIAGAAIVVLCGGAYLIRKRRRAKELMDDEDL